jgi:hypothetical protein
MSIKNSGDKKKRKRRRAEITEPGPEPTKLELEAPSADVEAKSKAAEHDEKPTGARKGERKPLSPEAQRAKDAAQRLYKDLGVGRSTDDEFSFGTDRFVLGRLDDFGRAKRGQRITGELL